MLLSRNLGNGRHFNVGPYFRSKLTFSPRITLTTKTSVAIYTPWIEQRFFRKKIDTDRIDNINPLPTEAEAASDIAFLSDVLINKFYPIGYDVQVWPGIELESTSRLEYKGTRAIVACGGDLWFKSKEKFVKIYGPETMYDDYFVKEAKTPFGYQTSIWVSIERKPKRRHLFDVSFQCESSVFTTGIGESFTMTLTIGHSF